MTRKFIVHPEVDVELEEAGQYYKREGKQLALAFADSVSRCFAAIQAHPLAGRQIRVGIRQRVTDRFPYAVVYFVSDKIIRVLAVAHLHRRPFYWAQRE